MTQAEVRHGHGAAVRPPSAQDGGERRHRSGPKLTPRQKKIRMARMQVTLRLQKATEISLWALLITGLLVTEYTGVPWSIKRWALSTPRAAF